MAIPPDLAAARSSALWREIHEQPEVIARLLDTQTAALRRFVADLPPRSFAHVAARGSSDHAATYGTYALAALGGMPVALATPSLHTIYAAPPRLVGALVVGISQSGQSPDVVSVLEEGRRQGQPTLAITNDASSPLARAADHVLELGAGEERSVAATKTYTAQLAAVALLAALLRERAGQGDALAALGGAPEAIGRTLALDDAVAELSVRYRFASRCLVLARGFNYATAKELALKLKELAGLLADAASSADFRHGPIALVEPDFPALLFAPTGRARDDMLALAQELHARGGDVLLIGDSDEAPVGRALRLPFSVDEWLSPLVTIVPGQLLALYIAQARTPDVDKPRGLRKVTLTT
jgi:glutamine---fructose-6-phosphate transaminase (isomerizing)